MSSRLVLNLHSLRRENESAYWGHNTTTQTSGMELRDWPGTPREYTAFPKRISYLKSSQRRQSNGSGRRPLAPPSPASTGYLTPRSAGYLTPRSASLFIRPFERSQNSTTTREMTTVFEDEKQRPVGETDLGTLSVVSSGHHRAFSRTNTIITPPPPLKVKVDVDVDFDIDIASGGSSTRSSWRSDGRYSPTPPSSCWHYGEAI
ncbi:hypothetical protein FRB90_008582 [Tulasnella sp. 427]|nr:hypothetical protein FRB90_008582 [Tulasnella sp. 427]